MKAKKKKHQEIRGSFVNIRQPPLALLPTSLSAYQNPRAPMTLFAQKGVVKGWLRGGPHQEADDVSGLCTAASGSPSSVACLLILRNCFCFTMPNWSLNWSQLIITNWPCPMIFGTVNWDSAMLVILSQCHQHKTNKTRAEIGSDLNVWMVWNFKTPCFSLTNAKKIYLSRTI